MFSLENWINYNGHIGFDHYDILAHPFFRFLTKNKLIKLQTILIDSIPNFFVFLFNINKNYNAKALALLIRAYIFRYKTSNDFKYLDKAIQCAEWLIENPSKGYKNFCWGYPFKWQAAELLNEGTPSSVVTSNVIDSLLEIYKITKEQKYLDVIVSGCRFFEEELNITNISENELSFSYTPFDREVCYNANIISAATIFKSSQFDRKISLEKAKKALEFTLNSQLPDGSWHYIYPNDGRIDPYHTGFILRALYDIYKVSPDERILNAISKGMEFYRNKLVNEDGSPLYRVNRKYPIDIHSCAETILCFSQISPLNQKYLNIALRTANWTIDNMQDKSGYFYYRKYPFHKVKIAYLRWSEAWMYFALAKLIYIVRNYE
ncbi:MAG: hypothetical protein HPY57_00090 [Ignavibacteria bacterium]|nr:hypothetical protein [Ignavibacteria bacterium]